MNTSTRKIENKYKLQTCLNGDFHLKLFKNFGRQFFHVSMTFVFLDVK